MAITRWDAVVDAVVAAVTTQAGSNATVWDGPPVTEERADAEIVIGAQIPLIEAPADPVSGRISQTWANMAGNSSERDEDGAILCQIVSSSGDSHSTAVAERRAAAATLMGYVETALRADIGLSLTGVAELAVTGATFYQVAHDEGTTVAVDFTIEYSIRI